MMNILNLNVGLLGHVDSGKTSLAKALSDTSSTAAFDKDPQAQERGITLDLGFSSFALDFTFKSSPIKFEKIQFTLVDCPGHASLIKTIIGGARIIDIMVLVIDATKGMQPQASEGLLLCEIMKAKLVVVVNKADLVSASALEKLVKKLKATIGPTNLKGSPVVTASALHNDVQGVIVALLDLAFLPERDLDKPFLFAIDHCFGIKGKGTVLTGTILQGTVKVSDTIEIPSINLKKKVKSLQVFRKPVDSAIQGDRVGICVTQFDPKLLERGIASTPSYVKRIYAAVMDFNKVQYFSYKIASKTNFNINVGYENIVASVLLFADSCDPKGEFSTSKEYKYLPEVTPSTSLSNMRIYVLLEFSKPILIATESLAIGMKLDAPVSSCRLAFYGHIKYGHDSKNYAAEFLPLLKVYKEKFKKGTLDRIMNENEIIGKNMFKRETNVHKFVGTKVTLATGEEGIIEGPFGKTGKFKVKIPGGMTYTFIPKEVKEKSEGIEIQMHHKRFLFSDNQISQK